MEAEDERVDFEDLLNKHRAAVDGLRSHVERVDPRALILEEFANRLLSEALEKFAPAQTVQDRWDLGGLDDELKTQFGLSLEEAGIRPLRLRRPPLRYALLQRLRQEYEAMEQILGAETMRYHERMVMLSLIDSLWKAHEESMNRFAESARAESGAQEGQLKVHPDECQAMFEAMMQKFRADSVRFIFRMQILGPDGKTVPRQPAISRPSPQSLLSLADRSPRRDR